MTIRRSPANLQRVLPRVPMRPGDQNEKELTVEYLTRLVASLQQVINELSNPGTLRCGNLVIYDAPTSTTGLNAGDVYVDANGFLKLWPG